MGTFGSLIFHKKSYSKEVYTFFYIINLVAKAPDLNFGKKLSNLLSNNQAWN